MVSGGYLAIRAMSLGVLTVCEHVVDVAPLTHWVTGWSDAALAFGLDEAALAPVRLWLEQVQGSVHPWHLADDPSVPSAFLRRFGLSGAVLGASTSRESAERMLADWVDDGTTTGLIELLQSDRPPEVGQLLGYDLLNLGYSGYEHSWRCFGFSPEEVCDPAFELNEFGLLANEAAAQRAQQILDDVSDSPPDGTWSCWAITRY
jgi:hypothetical protein